MPVANMSSTGFGEKAMTVLSDFFSTSFSLSNEIKTDQVVADVTNCENLITEQEKASVQEENAENYALRLLDLHPGVVKFSDLAEKMEPVIIEGMEKFTGILGIIEDKEIPWMSCDVIYNNDEDTFDDLKKKSNNVGKPIEGAIVWAHYALFVEGNVCPLACSKLKGYPERILVDEVLPGISAAAYWLRPGQRGQFLLPSYTMFGQQGQPPNIPPNARILMLLHSLYWVDAGAIKRYESLNYELRSDINNIRNLLENINEVGAVYHKQHSYGRAADIFSKLYSILDSCIPTESSLSEINEFKMRVCINLAICYIKVYKIDNSNGILEDAMDFGDWKNNCKYLYTRGRTYFEMYEPEKALEYLHMALNLEPNNITVGREIVKVEKSIKKEMKNEKEICKKMFHTKDEMANGILKFDKDTQDSVNAYLNAIKMLKSVQAHPVPSLLTIEEEELLEDSVKKIDELIFKKNKPVNGISKNCIMLVDKP